MKINPIAILQPYLEQKEMFCNGNAKVAVADDSEARSRVSQFSSVIFHKTLEEIPPSEGTVEIVYSRPVDPPERMQELMHLMFQALPQVSADLRVAYDDALSLLPPSVVAKDWGFSVDSQGSIVVLEGSNALSKNEKALIEKALTQAYVGTGAEEVADMVVRMLELDRMPTGVSSRMGKYDVTRNNFQEIIDLRAYLETHRAREKYQTHPHDYVSLHFLGSHFLVEQISVKAEVKYEYKKFL